MPNLIIYNPSESYSVFQFSNNIRIGRSKQNDIILKYLEISRFHASIKKEGNEYILSDHGSLNATKMNDQPIAQQTLLHGSTFQIGAHHFLFIEDMPSERAEKSVLDILEVEEKKWAEEDAKTIISFDQHIRREPYNYLSFQEKIPKIISLISEITSVLDPRELMDKTLDIVMAVTNSNRGFLALKNDDGRLVYKKNRGFDDEKDRFDINLDIVNKVMREGNPLLLDKSAAPDSRRHIKNDHIIPAMCAPLSMENAVVGCIYLDSPVKTDCYSNDDLEALTIIAQQIPIAMNNANLHQKIKNEKDDLQKRLRLKDHIIIKSEKSKKLYQDVQAIADINVPALITGESGSGKELVARALHELSKRSGEFVALNCSAIPENLFESELFGSVKGAYYNAMDKPGKLELAEGGTLFLDEIGDMLLSLQPKFLRFLENNEVTRLGDTKTRKINARIVAATNQNLMTMIAEKRFRLDLYQRLACLKLTSHPLRERKEDILPLIEFFLKKFSEKYHWKIPRISEQALEKLLGYHWPGNVRELENLILGISVRVRGRVIYPGDLTAVSEEFQGVMDQPVEPFLSMKDMEKKYIQKALRVACGNVSDAAKFLEIGRATLYEKIKRYKISTS